MRLGETAALQQVEDLIARGRLAVQRVVVLTKGFSGKMLYFTGKSWSFHKQSGR